MDCFCDYPRQEEFKRRSSHACTYVGIGSDAEDCSDRLISYGWISTAEQLIGQSTIAKLSNQMHLKHSLNNKGSSTDKIVKQYHT